MNVNGLRPDRFSPRPCCARRGTLEFPFLLGGAA
jgi:hypothetical protein